MSATEVLRRLLDERGVWWHDTKIGKGFITVYEHDCITWIVTEHSSGRLSVKGCVKPTQGHYDGMTPAQAIAATLGSCNCSDNCTNGERTETCHVESSIIDTYEYNRWEYELSCGHTIIWEDSEPPNYCPICGRRIEQ